jgi:ABC-2 type transport system permease protein
MKINENFRIIWAIASKDIIDAIKNKIVQGVLIGVAFLMLSSQALPILIGLKNQSSAYFWDQGKSNAIQDIVRNRELNLHSRDSRSDLYSSVSQSPEPVLGIVIPSNFDEQVQSREKIKLQAVYANWVDQVDQAELKTYFDEQLSLKIGLPIEVNSDGDLAYPPVDGLGYPMMIAFGVVLGVMTVGLLLTPYLIVDEKETHTIDTLLISPARTFQILIGKSLVGLFYSLTASLVIFVFSWRWITHWDIMIMAIVFGGLCAVSFGLLIGAIIESPANVNIVVALILAVFLMPMYFWTSLASKLSPVLNSLMLTLPTIAMYRLVRISFTEAFNGSQIWINGAILISWIIVMLTLVGWRIRLLDR